MSRQKRDANDVGERGHAHEVIRALRPASRVTGANPEVAFLFHALPTYRSELLRLVRHALGDNVSVLAGPSGFLTGVRSEFDDKVERVRNVFLFRRRLLWQRRCVVRMLRPDVVVLELNPRIVSSWAILILRRARGRPTLLWGHAWPRPGMSIRSDRLRHVMRMLADTIVVYTETQARELQERMPGKSIIAAPNAIYSTAQAVVPDRSGEPRNAIAVGRLVDEKKPALLLEAFLGALEDLPSSTRLVFIGEGPLRPALEERVAAAGASERVVFAGQVTSFDDLRRAYAGALASVLPGSAGLALIQSHWFGVPTIVARSDAHGPEIEAVEAGLNAVLVDSGSVAALREALVQVLAVERERWQARRADIAVTCVHRYSLEATAQALLRAVAGVSR